jgi:predicted DNA-binding antitoxin AbrB/MazE fold protein
MTTTVDAIYEGGKLVLTQALPLPDHSSVRVTIESGLPQTDAERAAWLNLSESALREVWDNPADDVFNDLLKK